MSYLPSHCFMGKHFYVLKLSFVGILMRRDAKIGIRPSATTMLSLLRLQTMLIHTTQYAILSVTDWNIYRCYIWHIFSKLRHCSVLYRKRTLPWPLFILGSLLLMQVIFNPLRWRHNGGDSVSNHQPRECLLNRLIRCRSKKTSKLRVTGLCVGNSPGTGEFPAQMASNAENVSIWWRHHAQHSWVNTNPKRCGKKLVTTHLCVVTLS